MAKRQIVTPKASPKASGKVVSVNRLEARTTATNAILATIRGKEVLEHSISRKLKASTGDIKGSLIIDFFNGKQFVIQPMQDGSKGFEVWKHWVIKCNRQPVRVDTNVATQAQAIAWMRSGKYRKEARNDWE